MKNEELKKLVKEVIGNNDPYWNEPVCKIVEEIINLPNGTETTIVKLLNNNEYTSKQLFDIYLCVNKVCNKINIKLDFSKNNAKVDGLLYNIPFVKKIIPICPNCKSRLFFLMPSGKILCCDNCGKYYINKNGIPGNETSSPYNNKDVLY